MAVAGAKTGILINPQPSEMDDHFSNPLDFVLSSQLSAQQIGRIRDRGANDVRENCDNRDGQKTPQGFPEEEARFSC